MASSWERARGWCPLWLPARLLAALAIRSRGECRGADVLQQLPALCPVAALSGKVSGQRSCPAAGSPVQPQLVPGGLGAWGPVLAPSFPLSKPKVRPAASAWVLPTPLSQASLECIVRSVSEGDSFSKL